MHSLMRRVEVVYVATGGDGEGKRDMSSLDFFHQAKIEISQILNRVRAGIKERDKLTAKSPTDTKTIEQAQQVRRELKEAKDVANKMKDDLMKENKRMIKKLPKSELESRQEQLDLIWRHIEECENFEKRRYQPKSGSSSTSNTNPSRTRIEPNSSDPPQKLDPETFHPAVNTSLPPIEVQQELQVFKKRDQELDKGLTEISKGIKRVKNAAEAIGDELDLQAGMLVEIEKKVDDANEHMLNINRKMKETLKRVKAADRFLINFILLMIVLGIAAYLYSAFGSKIGQ
eukprot:c11787_g2_i1.p1 GENE.c11787_g2_i1~~c11787_g2_i1.p1  ORF type:complete len:296 (+),score=96.57 c11787_g2_i1:30-890(+)